MQSGGERDWGRGLTASSTADHAPETRSPKVWRDEMWRERRFLLHWYSAAGARERWACAQQCSGGGFGDTSQGLCGRRLLHRRPAAGSMQEGQRQQQQQQPSRHNIKWLRAAAGGIVGKKLSGTSPHVAWPFNDSTKLGWEGQLGTSDGTVDGRMQGQVASAIMRHMYPSPRAIVDWLPQVRRRCQA